MSCGAVKDSVVERAYKAAKESYGLLGVDTEKALRALKNIPVSLHCWQGDDVRGFESAGAALGDGLVATGSFPGRARNPGELRADIEKACSMIPGLNRVNVHAIYLDNKGKKVDRDQITPAHFASWVDWAKESKLKLDFNPSYFSHPKAAAGTLSSPDRGVRKFWVEHGKRCREIAAGFSKKLGGKVVINFWIPDGAKDFPADRKAPRERLAESYDEIFAKPAGENVKDALEGKLFGIGSEEYVVGSSEFYLAYAMSRKKVYCMDMGHYHPTETIHDKLSAVLTFMPEVLIHVSRPIRWDSDHVVVLNDDTVSLAREIVRCGYLDRVFLATDYFDASINRIGAWVIGGRSVKKALLFALLEPVSKLKALEKEGKGAAKLALMEEAKTMPFGAVWDYFCLSSGVPAGASWIDEMTSYEAKVLSKRG